MDAARTIVLDDSERDVLSVVVRGEHDIYTAPALRDRLEEALSAGPAGVIVDLSHNYVVCLGEDPEPGVARILEITGLVPVFPVVRSRDEALTAARSAPAAEA